MRIACFIPVKAFSERVKGKNFREIGGKALYKIITQKALASECFDSVYVDTNSREISEWAKSTGAIPIQREPALAENTANGNDLLVYQQERHPKYDMYFQLFATAPLMKVETIQECVHALLTTTSHDSVFTAINHQGFFWWNSQPVNYQPNILPRSQDLVPVMEETTGLYGIYGATLARFKSRVGARPLIRFVNKTEAIDLNNEDDFHYANWLVEQGVASV